MTDRGAERLQKFFEDVGGLGFPIIATLKAPLIIETRGSLAQAPLQ